MLNTKKLLYILPDAAYIAELLPAKKPNTFAIQAFRQINGNFINEDEFIAENVEKLIKKIDAEEYHLILPDFLFTNTIVDVNETSESAVKEHLKEKLLPSLGLNKETHELDTFILTQHQGKSKVQLSALEKSLLAPVQKAAEEQSIKITDVSPLSWTIKSVISLEPSLSTIQMGTTLYLAQHYIGIDQTISFKIEETDNIVETVKTLKGAEPNIQTMYLLTNPLVESQLKEKLSGTLPIQQLSNFADEQEGIPSYVKQVIEAGAKTLHIAEYPVPKFSLGKAVVTPENSAESKTEEKKELSEEKVEEESMPKTASDTSSELPSPSLPTPTAPVVAAATASTGLSVATEDISAPSPAAPIKDTPEEETAPNTEKAAEVVEALPEKEVPAPTEPLAAPMATIIPETKPSEPEKLPEIPMNTPEPVSPTPATTETPTAQPTVTFSSPIEAARTSSPAPAPVATPIVNTPPVAPTPATPLSFPSSSTAPAITTTLGTASVATSAPVSPSVLPSSNSAPVTPMNTPIQTPAPMNPIQPTPMSMPQTPVGGHRPVIKNKSDSGSLFKMIFVTVGALVATVAVGVGIGFGLLKMSEKNSPLNSNVVVEKSQTPEASPQASPSPVASVAPATTASDSATLSKDKVKILVVNATTISGKAGKIKTTLSGAGYKSIDTGNAKGKYEQKGMLVQMTKEDSAFVTQLGKDLSVTLVSDSGKETEDPKSAYDVVVVINE